MTVDCERCPPALKLRSVCKELEELKAERGRSWNGFDKEKERIWGRRDSDYQHWEEEVQKRLKTSTAQWALGIVVAITMAVLGVMFGTLLSGQNSNAAKIEQGLKDHSTKMEEVQEDMNKGFTAVQKDLTKLGTQLEERTGQKLHIPSRDGHKHEQPGAGE